MDTNQTTNIAKDSSEIIHSISKGFSNTVSYIVDWFTRFSWLEWLIILFIVVLIFVLLYLKAKMKEKTRRFKFA